MTQPIISRTEVAALWKSSAILVSPSSALRSKNILLNRILTWHCPNRSEGCILLTSRFHCHLYPCLLSVQRAPWEHHCSEEDFQEDCHSSCRCLKQCLWPGRQELVCICKHLVIQQLFCRISHPRRHHRSQTWEKNFTFLTKIITTIFDLRRFAQCSKEMKVEHTVGWKSKSPKYSLLCWARYFLM